MHSEVFHTTSAETAVILKVICQKTAVKCGNFTSHNTTAATLRHTIQLQQLYVAQYNCSNLTSQNTTAAFPKSVRLLLTMAVKHLWVAGGRGTLVIMVLHLQIQYSISEIVTWQTKSRPLIFSIMANWHQKFATLLESKYLRHGSILETTIQC